MTWLISLVQRCNISHCKLKKYIFLSSPFALERALTVSYCSNHISDGNPLLSTIFMFFVLLKCKLQLSWLQNIAFPLIWAEIIFSCFNPSEFLFVINPTVCVFLLMTWIGVLKMYFVREKNFCSDNTLSLKLTSLMWTWYENVSVHILGQWWQYSL